MYAFELPEWEERYCEYAFSMGYYEKVSSVECRS